MSELVGNVLHSWDKSVPSIVADEKRSIINIIMDLVDKELREKGDRILIREAENDANDFKFDRQESRLSELGPKVIQLANALIRQGLAKGDVVQVSMHNNCDFFFPVLATWMAGGVVSMSDPSVAPKVMHQQLKLIKATFIFCTPDVVDNILLATNNLEIKSVICVNGSHSSTKVISAKEFIGNQGGDASSHQPRVHEQARLDELAAIFWSSGTTGNPKGIQFSHRCLVDGLTNDVFAANITNSKCYLQTTCMFHAGGFQFCLAISICFGIELVTMSLKTLITSHSLFKACAKYKPTVLMIGSHHGFQLSGADPDPGLDLSSVLEITPIGAPLNDNVSERLREKFPNLENVFNAYGMTETSGVSKGTTFTNLGKLNRGYQVKIRNPDTDDILGPNEVGEILIKSSSLMMGYINVSEEEASGAFTCDGYFKSGDVGWYDENGQLYYKERRKALIKYENRHVYPAEIEELIQTLPGVVEVGVFGIPDHNVQELIAAAVTIRHDAKLTEVDILDHVNSKVEDCKKIRGGVFITNSSLPRNLQGKILRWKLKEFAKPIESSGKHV